MNHTRSIDIIHPEILKSAHVAVIGTGGIGAATALALAKMGIGHLYLYDFDTIEDVNIPNQLLPIGAVGKPKVVGLIEAIRFFTDGKGVAYRSRVTPDTHLPDVDLVITALDSITARQQVWQARRSGFTRYWLDSRMSAQTFQLYTIDLSGGTAWYETMLMGTREEDVPNDPCTAKAIIFTAFMAAGHIANQVMHLLKGEPAPAFLFHDIARFDLRTEG
nr:ThiF family adenylyltransferase [Anaerolineae bacterium]